MEHGHIYNDPTCGCRHCAAKPAKTDKHTTLVMVLLDGTHRTTSWTHSVDFHEVCRTMKDQVRWLRNGIEVVAAFLACGPQHMNYTAAEVKEFVK